METRVREGCARHDLCAYDGSEEGRCPSCHSLWTVILVCSCPDCGTRENHLAVHARRDAARWKGIVRLRAQAIATDAPARGPERRYRRQEPLQGITGTPRSPEAANSRADAP